jgi:uncharacterized protein
VAEPSALTYVFLGVAVLLSAWVQGFSGVGFSLIAAPAITQIIPGSAGIGVVNVLALAQNSWQIWREEGVIHWGILRQMGPGLLMGFGIGVAGLFLLPERMRPAVVALSSLLSMAALLWWRPRPTATTATLSGTWGGAVNTYAGVGGPPLAAFLVRQGWEPGSYIRTQQTVFAALNIASIPILGVRHVQPLALLGGVVVVAIGASVGIWMRHRVPAKGAMRVSVAMILVVSGVAFIRSMIQLLG